MTDPYAPVVFYARSATPDTQTEEKAVTDSDAEAGTGNEDVVESTPEELSIPDGSVNEVLSWIGDDKRKAQYALDNDQRKGVKRGAQEVLDG